MKWPENIGTMQGMVVEWISPLLPDRQPMATAVKMTEELSELMGAMLHGDKNIGEECADVLILLLDIAYLNGVDISEEFWEKMKINRGRSWTPKQGALKHENANQQDA